MGAQRMQDSDFEKLVREVGDDQSVCVRVWVLAGRLARWRLSDFGRCDHFVMVREQENFMH